MAAIRGGDLWNRSGLLYGGVEGQEKSFGQPTAARWLCFEHKQEIHFQSVWNPQAKRKKNEEIRWLNY